MSQEICEHCKSYATFALIDDEMRCPVCHKSPDKEPMISEQESIFVRINKGQVKDAHKILSIAFKQAY